MNWLVDEWRQAWKWLQTWLGVIVAMAPQLWDLLIPMQTYLPATAFKWVMTILGIAVIINAVRRKPV